MYTTWSMISRAAMCLIFFFFSSRRRHTRCSRDWSSDVCSSDLINPGVEIHRNLGKARGATGTARKVHGRGKRDAAVGRFTEEHGKISRAVVRSEEHTSELQSRLHLVCRLLLEKKKKKLTTNYSSIINIPNSTYNCHITLASPPTIRAMIPSSLPTIYLAFIDLAII